MELATVLGNIVATRKVENLLGQRLLWIQPEDDDGEPKGPPLAAVDTTRAAPGQRVFFVRAREAAEALDEPFNPVDAAIVGQVRHLDLESPPES
jgi:ethanolamine utilization protein EutN